MKHTEMYSEKLLPDWEKRHEYGNMQANLDFLEQVNILDKSKKILEIGSGKGTLLNLLCQKGFQVQGVDVDPALLKESQELYGELPFSLINSETLPFEDASFDVIISFDVFEHIPDTDKHLSEIRRILTKDGCYAFQTPNKYTNVVFETIRARSFTKWRDEHCSLHSYTQMFRRFKKHGFEIKFYDIPVVTEFFERKIQNFLGKPGLFALKILNPDKMPMPLRTNFFVLARKSAPALVH